MKFRGQGNAIPIALGVLAVVIAGSGTAVAVSSTTTISDPVTPANVARVDNAGRLSTIGVTSSLNTLQYVPPAVNRVTLIDPTSSSIAITRISYTNPAANLGSSDTNFQLTIAQYRVGASKSCTGTDATLVAVISRQATTANTSAENTYATPYVAKPAGSAKTCIAASNTVYGTLPGTYYYPTVQLTGYVASGNYTGIGTPTSPAVVGTASTAG